jgi:hypothetical protein
LALNPFAANSSVAFLQYGQWLETNRTTAWLFNSAVTDSTVDIVEGID